MNHARKTDNVQKRKRQIKHLRTLLVLLGVAVVATAITIYRDYQARPGFLEKIWIADRGADYITVAWERARNVNKYVVTYNGETIEVSGRRKNIKITGLTENTEYKFSVRADSKERQGFEAIEETARTKKFSHITGEENFTKFANRPVDLKQTAETDVTYVPGNGYNVTDDGKVVFTSAGKVTVTAKTSETAEYASVSRELTVDVLDTVAVDADGAAPHIFYKLNKDMCECVRRIEGVKEATTPQAFVYHEGKYLVTYIWKDVQRLVEFGDSKSVYIPDEDLGHANSLTIAHGRCYLARGASTRCDTFDPPSNNYSSFELAYVASGIAYDVTTGMFYTSSREQLVAYDSEFNVVNRLGRVNRSETYYVQDCGAYGGILMQGVSGAEAKGTNYIDFYDMTNSTYLGSIECELNEIESIIVDDDGYIEVLSNAKGKKDYIWKTPINMKDLCD